MDDKKIVKGPVTVKKESELRKVANAFKDTEKGNMGHRIFTDIVEPIAKKALSDIVSSTANTISGILTNGVDMLLFKEPKHMNNGTPYNSLTHGASGSTFSYNKCFTGATSQFGQPISGGNVYDYESLEFTNRGDAERVLEMLREQVDIHGIVHVATLYQAVNLAVQPIYFKYGWTDIDQSNSRVIRTYNGKYNIKLPRASYIKS